MSEPAAARVSVLLSISAKEAFRSFTEDISLWWKATTQTRFRADRRGTLHFQEGRPRTLLEIYPDSEHEPFVVGRVLDWQPGHHLRFEWRDIDYEPGEATEVEVRFEAVGEGTRVTVEHRGWEALSEEHPSLHGLEGPALSALLGQRWADQLVAFSRHLSARLRP